MQQKVTVAAAAATAAWADEESNLPEKYMLFERLQQQPKLIASVATTETVIV